MTGRHDAIRRLDPATTTLVIAAAELFDGPPLPERRRGSSRATGHHLLMA